MTIARLRPNLLEVCVSNLLEICDPTYQSGNGSRWFACNRWEGRRGQVGERFAAINSNTHQGTLGGSYSAWPGAYSAPGRTSGVTNVGQVSALAAECHHSLRLSSVGFLALEISGILEDLFAIAGRQAEILLIK